MAGGPHRQSVARIRAAHAHGSSSRVRSACRHLPALVGFTHFLELPKPRQSQRAYIDIHQRTRVAEITGRETHMRKLLGFFHMTELSTLEYDQWQVRFHGAQSRLNYSWYTMPVHLAPMAPGVVDAATTREDRKARECITAEEADEA
ncbi:hypothetical protein ZWY2020_038728 [Hordeum vulgare]|nr:hypothetical protein ZWY2020_038728 [Hordeum vulgare]